MYICKGKKKDVVWVYVVFKFCIYIWFKCGLLWYWLFIFDLNVEDGGLDLVYDNELVFLFVVFLCFFINILLLFFVLLLVLLLLLIFFMWKVFIFEFW